jgi:hypothetical protein
MLVVYYNNLCRDIAWEVFEWKTKSGRRRLEAEEELAKS